ncbi:hypothetical protein DBV15_10584 [Temnothorax longispinosus]|uniref:Uncharacterized protein n=1 Tax=Temnothorax longispinosus TaxID=300112 RepID=A0A4S2KX61_9HYME|nr:hypothetical protein DBV15_10584 [Temnothorax longispinosus]
MSRIYSAVALTPPPSEFELSFKHGAWPRLGPWGDASSIDNLARGARRDKRRHGGLAGQLKSGVKKRLQTHYVESRTVASGAWPPQLLAPCLIKLPVYLTATDGGGGGDGGGGEEGRVGSNDFIREARTGETSSAPRGTLGPLLCVRDV